MRRGIQKKSQTKSQTWDPYVTTSPDDLCDPGRTRTKLNKLPRKKRPNQTTMLYKTQRQRVGFARADWRLIYYSISDAFKTTTYEYFNWYTHIYIFRYVSVSINGISFYKGHDDVSSNVFVVVVVGAYAHQRRCSWRPVRKKLTGERRQERWGWRGQCLENAQWWYDAAGLRFLVHHIQACVHT